MAVSPQIGIANSVSVNFNYDPVDTIEYARQGNFELLQVFLNMALLGDKKTLQHIEAADTHFDQIYYHADGYLNDDFPESEYCQRLYSFLETIRTPSLVIHFDERESIDSLIGVARKLSERPPILYLENYFLKSGKENAEKNLKKYLALFTLSSTFGVTLRPVLDIPRFFHQNLEFNEQEALEWCFQSINFFANRQIPILLHLIDANSAAQERLTYTAVGSGYIPYEKIFRFIRKTRPPLAGIILEFEDKVHPLTSRDYLKKTFEG